MLRAILRVIFSMFLDAVVPPRRTEHLIRSTDETRWRLLMEEDGLPYRDPRVAALVWEVKYYGSVRAAAAAASVLAERVHACAGDEIGVPLLLPVPMHRARRRLRGHNQTEALCEALTPYCQGMVEYRTDVLSRVVDTPHQQGLERAKRLVNVCNSMRATATAQDRICIVIDDVTTTGATLREAERALSAAGARGVYALALAYS